MATVAFACVIVALVLAPVTVAVYRAALPSTVTDADLDATPTSTVAVPRPESPANEPLATQPTQPTQPRGSDFNRSGFPSSITVPPSYLIATLSGPTPAYADSTTPTVLLTIPATYSAATLALPVIAEQNQRVEVRLLQRPNNVTAWIAQSSVSLTRTPYHLYVDLSTHRLLLYDNSKLVLRAPAGLGAPQTPTPAGNYFVALFAQSPSPGYGPFVIVTSALADTITDWEQDGNPMIAITGPLDSQAVINAGGGAVTRGSIGLLDEDLSRLRNVPAGTPIDVVTTLRPAASVKGKTTTT
ncbi:MAG TPA: L,D-transpeptidase [Acidimicrobiales bacterium]|nr:L,D-transpeptidase [Acidimicrobiales bacterium]